MQDNDEPSIRENSWERIDKLLINIGLYYPTFGLIRLSNDGLVISDPITNAINIMKLEYD